jgi:hypothetical protein
MSSVPVHSLTSLDGTAIQGTWEPIQAQRNSVFDMSNPKCPRHIIVDSSGIVITSGTKTPVHLSMELILAAAIKANPDLDVPTPEPAKKPPVPNAGSPVAAIPPTEPANN